MGDFPLNDDWRYAYLVKSWMENGSISISDDFAPTILLQVVWGYIFSLPFGVFSFTTLRFSTLILGFFGVAIFYKLILELTSSPQKSFLAGLLLMLQPLYFNLSFSFMTDVPFLTFCLLTIYAIYQYLKFEKNRYLIFIILGSIACFLIRQPGILFLPTLGVLIFIKKGINLRSFSIFGGLLLVSALTYLSFDFFLKPIMNIEEAYVPVTQLFYENFLQNPLQFGLEIFKKIIKTIIYIGFFTIPIFPFLIQKIREAGGFDKKVIFSILVVNTFLLFFLHSIGKIFPFGGNILFNFGLGPELLTDVYTFELKNTPRLPMVFMYIFNFIGQVVGSWVVLLIFKNYRSLQPLQKDFFGFLFLLNAIYLPLMSITSFFDRYLLLTFASVFLFLMLLVKIEKWNFKNLKYALPFALMSFYSIAGTKDYLAWHRTKFEAFDFLKSQNIEMEEIDAGFELNGWYNYQKGYESPKHLSFWWVNKDNYIITFGEMEGFKTIKSYTFWSTLHFKNRQILILKKEEQ